MQAPIRKPVKTLGLAHDTAHSLREFAKFVKNRAGLFEECSARGELVSQWMGFATVVHKLAASSVPTQGGHVPAYIQPASLSRLVASEVLSAFHGDCQACE
jgi:hypothetical protein